MTAAITTTTYTMHVLPPDDAAEIIDARGLCPECCKSGEYDAPLSWLNLYRHGWHHDYIVCERHQTCWFFSTGRDHGEEAEERQRDLARIRGLRHAKPDFLRAHQQQNAGASGLPIPPDLLEEGRAIAREIDAQHERGDSLLTPGELN